MLYSRTHTHEGKPGLNDLWKTYASATVEGLGKYEYQQIEKEFFARFFKELFPVAMGITQDANNAEDLLQEVALLLFESKQRYLHIRSIIAWSATVMRRKYYDGKRKMKPSSMEEVLDTSSHNLEILGDFLREEHSVDTRVLTDYITASVLKNRSKELFTLLVRGLNLEEITQKLDLKSKNSSAVTKARLIQKIRAHFEEKKIPESIEEIASAYGL